MKSKLQYISIENFTTSGGKQYDVIPLSFQVFGKTLGKAPVVLVNHALTGNSNVAGIDGWWQALIGADKLINTTKYTVLAFNIPGNGYDTNLIENYKDFRCSDIAKIFLEGLKILKINTLFAAMGGSLGGGVSWEMAAINNSLIKHLIPIASDWKSSDWLIANCLVQNQILSHSSKPIHDARLHAMLCYRSPQSFKAKFNRSVNEELQVFNVESWLLHHGRKLEERFELAAYKLMNRLLATIDITKDKENFETIAEPITSKIHLISVDSDLFFTEEEDKETYKRLLNLNKDVEHHTIKSIHGHDAFLIEFEQLSKFLKPIFT